MNLRKTFIYCLCTLCCALSAVLTSCSSDEVYESSVTRDMVITLDGNPWNIYYGTTNKPLFIYGSDGRYLSNYSTSYRFSLDNGDYRVVATTQSVLMTPPTALNEQLIAQDSLTKTVFAISDPVSYKAGDKLVVPMKTRTGVLRLKSTDTKADKSYSIVRAVMQTPVVAYNVGEGRMLTGEPVMLKREKETKGGGIGYTDDAVLLETQSTGQKVSLKIEYLDADSNVVNTKVFQEPFEVVANDTVEVAFELNNPDEQVIVNYTISLFSQQWQDETLYPTVPIDVPEGYTYCEPGVNLNNILTQQKSDAEVEEIKLFLKANATYTLSANTLSGLSKPLSIKGQDPGFNQKKATLSLGAVSMTGELSEIRFENLEMKCGDRFFNLRNQTFHVGEIAFVGCDWNNWSGTLWYQQTNADRQQVVDRVVMDGCRFINFSAGSSALWGLSTRQVAPVYSFTFSNCVFHGKNLSTRTVLLSGLTKVDGTLSVTIDGCTFYDAKGTAMTWMDIDGASATATSITLTNNTLSGVSGNGTWLKLGKYDTLKASGNRRTTGYTLAVWGCDEPAENGMTADELLNLLNIK